MRRLRRIIAVFLISAALCGTPGAFAVSAASDGDKTTYNRYNVVLVTDTSGSMNSTDTNGLRFEAIGKFVALLAERGNKIGAVAFNGDITYRQDIINADGIETKRGFIDSIKEVPAEGFTNIGKGLLTAVEMLDTQKDPDLPSIILLLSDGNTALETTEEVALSLEQKADAIQSAREAGYKIYSVNLNANHSANSVELSQIANATGGQFQEVNDASDLEDVFSMFYSIIFSSKLDKGAERTFPSSGIIEDTFEIPSVGVEEVNIVLSGNVTDCSLTDPDGRQLTEAEITAITYSSDTFNVIKIENPLAGIWSYKIRGVPDDIIQINIVYNTHLSCALKVEPQKDIYMSGDVINISACLYETGKAIGVNQYQGFSAVLTVTDGQGGSEVYDMRLGSEGFGSPLTFTQVGTYTISARITGYDYDLSTESVALNIGNTPPVSNASIEKTVLLWPFSDNKASIDLTPGATDAQDTLLRYEVESSAFLDDEFTLREGVLDMSGYSLTKGSFRIRAYDTAGAYCTFDVIVSTVNMTVLGIILLAGGIVLALAIIIIGLWIALNKRFMGACYVTQFDDTGEYYEEVRREKGRGRMYLSSFNLKDTGFNTSKCYFQATGKDYVLLCMNQTVYGDGRYDKNIKVNGSGYEVVVSKDSECQKGIRVKFISRLNNTQFFLKSK